MSRIHPDFTYSSQCHELNASHEKISQRYGTHWFLHKLKDSIKFLEFSKSSKRREAKSHHNITPDGIFIQMSRTLCTTRGSITKVCDALTFLHPDELLNSWHVNESELPNSRHVTEGFVILPHHPAEAAADFLNEFCFGVVFLKESSKFHELNRSSICHELSESNFITSRT